MSVPPAPLSTTDGRTNPPCAPAQRPRTLLVAEDDDAVRSFVTAVLETAGFVVVSAPDGLTAGDLFAADPARFDLVLTDVIMPYALGTEFALRARALRADVPVLFMSAFPGGAGIAPEPLPPDEPLLEKPFSAAALLAAVHGALAHAV
ncbi:MAG: response regulator [Planctomycetes bacterium]|nr:response regulator [Planctomycetota bacterium]